MRSSLARLRLALSTSTLAASLAFAGAAPADSARRLDTPRGAPIEVLVERPPGKGPFPALVLAPGAGYHMRLPILDRNAKALLKRGVAVFRFNWAYFVRDGAQGKQSDDRASEVEDMQTVLRLARSTASIDPARIYVGGKSLGSIVSWRVFRGDPALAGALLLTPVCTKPTQPSLQPEQNYPELSLDRRPVQWILGDADPVCEPRSLFRFLANAPRVHRVAVLDGNHSFERSATPEKVPSATTERQLALAAELAADFIANASSP